MEFELVGGSYDGLKIDLPVDRFGHTEQELNLPKREKMSGVKEGAEKVKFEVYVKTPVGLQPDGSTKFIFAIR